MTIIMCVIYVPEVGVETQNFMVREYNPKFATVVDMQGRYYGDYLTFYNFRVAELFCSS